MKALVVLIFLSLVGVFAWFSADCCDGDSRMASELSSDVAMADIDMTKIDVQVDHVDVVLTGTVPIGRGEIIVDEVGIALRAGRVINLLDEDGEVEASSPPSHVLIPATVFFQRRGKDLLLKGTVDNAITKRRLGEIASRLPGDPRVINELEVSEQARPLPDARLIPGFGATFMQESKEGYFEWTDDRFVMRGEVTSAWVKDGIGAHVLPLLHGRTLENNLSVSSADPAGVICLVSKGVGGSDQGVLRGTVGTSDLRVRSLLAAREADPEIIWTDELGVAPESAAFSTTSFPGHIRRFLAVRGGVIGGFRYDSNGLSVVGVTDENENARLTKALEETDAVSVEKAMVAEEPVAAEEEVIPETEEWSAVTAAQVQAQLKGYAIYFGTNKETASAEELSKVAGAYKILSELNYTNGLVVGGYADPRGNAAYNRALSLRRAESVKAELVRLGINEKRIRVESFGSAPKESVAENGDNLGNQRRVEIQFESAPSKD